MLNVPAAACKETYNANEHFGAQIQTETNPDLSILKAFIYFFILKAKNNVFGNFSVTLMWPCIKKYILVVVNC